MENESNIRGAYASEINGGSQLPEKLPSSEVQDGDSGNTERELQKPNGTSGNGEQAVSVKASQTNANPTPTDEEKRTMIDTYCEDSLAQGILAFNSFTIKKKAPTVFGVMLKWMNETAHMGGVIDEESSAGVLLYAPRSVLFNFFDSQEIFVNVQGNYGKWGYTIAGDVKISLVGGTHKSRTEAEFSAFMKAFEILEANLIAINYKP